MKLLFLLIISLSLNEFLCESVLEKNEEVLSREKRIAIDGADMSFRSRGESAAAGDLPFPIIIPPYNNSLDIKTQFTKRDPKWGSCLMYMEDITVVAINAAKQSGGQSAVFAHLRVNQTNTYGYDLDCTIQNFTADSKNRSYIWFDIKVNLKTDVNGRMASSPSQQGDVGYTLKSNTNVEFKLYFRIQSLDNWYLEYAELVDINITPGKYLDKALSASDFKKNGNISVEGQPPSNNQIVYTGDSYIRSMYGYSYGCSATPGFFFTTGEGTDKIALGFQLNNFQVEAYNIYANMNDTTKSIAVGFKSQVNDCVPTFSVGSWMSIIASLILAAVFIFGFLMLNSIQTMDRFDDPKAKQIIINTKE